jgi:NADH:ubiquinone oxidoreductase subunit 6 (subunit J)
MGSLVDFTAIWQVCLIALIGGVGIVTLFSVGIVGLNAHNVRRTRSAAVLGMAVACVCFLLSLGAVVLGVWVMLDK